MTSSTKLKRFAFRCYLEMVFLMVQRFMKLQRKYRHIDGNDYFPLVVGIISAIDGHS